MGGSRREYQGEAKRNIHRREKRQVKRKIEGERQPDIHIGRQTDRQDRDTRKRKDKGFIRIEI